ncbi:MAG: ribosomal protein S18-alanine N-acetyltransferase [Candidatus Binatia bacterium]
MDKTTEEAAQPLHRQVSLRPCGELDLSAVLAIEQASFPLPWQEAFFLAELQNPQSRFLVAGQEGRVIGYLCGWLVADEVQILRIAVHPAHRRQGIGKALLLATLAEAYQEGARAASLEVRRSNLPALAFYTGLGFRQVATRRRYYENGEDALLLVWDL